MARQAGTVPGTLRTVSPSSRRSHQALLFPAFASGEWIDLPLLCQTDIFHTCMLHAWGILFKILVEQENTRAAYSIANLEILDRETYAEFRRRFPGMVEAFGGKLLGRGDVVEALGEETPSGYHRVIIMEFPTVEQVRAWDTAQQNSPEYAELRVLRHKSGNAVLTIVSGD